MIWLAVLVTLGIRSNVAALFAGLSFTILPALALVYLPRAWGNVPPVLFGLGAIAVAKYPEGTLAMQARQVRWLWTKSSGKRRFARRAVGAAGAGPTQATRPSPSRGRHHRRRGRGGSTDDAGMTVGDDDRLAPTMPDRHSRATADGVRCRSLCGRRCVGPLRRSESALERRRAVPPATIVGLVGPNGAGKSHAVRGAVGVAAAQHRLRCTWRART